MNGLVLEGVVGAKIIGRKPVVVKVVGDLIWEKSRNSSGIECELEEFQSACLPLYWSALRQLQSTYMRCVDAVVTPSKYLAQLVKKWGVSADRIHVIENSVEAKQKISRSDSQCDLVTVARLVPWKGLGDLIEVAAAIGASLLIVGSGPLREQLEALAVRLKANVTFVGRVPHDEVECYLRQAKLFVLNSTYEGLPHIVLEAKSAGVAVLATNAGGTPETIDHGVDGWLVPAGNRDALRSAIVSLLRNDSLREAIANAGARRVAEQFTLERQVKDTIAVLERVGR